MPNKSAKELFDLFSKIFFITLILLLPAHSKAQTVPSKCFENVKDYAYTWWNNTIKNSNDVLGIKTNHYAFSFDYSSMQLLNLFIDKNPVTEKAALREANSASFPVINTPSLTMSIKNNGVSYLLSGNSGNIHDFQLVESGKFYQRRFLEKIRFQTGAPNIDTYKSGLEIAAWPDRFTILLRLNPSVNLTNGGLEMSFTFPSNFNTILQNGDIKALKASDGSGFIILKSKNATAITISGTTVKVSLDLATWTMGNEINGGMVIYPVSADIDSKLAEFAETQPITITAHQVAPTVTDLNVQYDDDQGWYQIGLRNDGNVADYSSSSNDRMERVNLSLQNTTSSDRTIRLKFAKERDLGVFGVTGLSAMLRDMNRYPLGIPVQLSKNWHVLDPQNIEHYYRGTWFHGYTILTIPANTTVNIEYTSVNAHWGGVPAASHAQLSLVGWGSNQLWSQSAIGSWGESICYEPDLDQTQSPLLDFRPLMVQDVNSNKWGWAGNVGGADFFNYKKTNNLRGWHSRMRTQYERYCPNLAEVTFAGTTDDDAFDFEYSTSIYRSDDITRGIYKIKMKANKSFSFNDFSFFQVAAPKYHYSYPQKLAVGNEKGLKTEIAGNYTGSNTYITTKVQADGSIPWFSLHDTNLNTSEQSTFRPANKGFVIREWKARINGTNDVQPFWAEFAASGGNGQKTPIFCITPPANISHFQAGDSIEAVFELFIIPKQKIDYYGTNQSLINALDSAANTWKMVRREAIGNNLVVKTSAGILKQKYPVIVQASESNASFTIQGGIGYVPVMIKDVSKYDAPKLYEKIGGYWRQVNQSVYGNDFWQTDFNPTSGKWDITYNINLDNDGNYPRDFSFGDTLYTATGASSSPENLLATAKSANTIELSWEDNTNNETVFILERSSDGGTSWSYSKSLSENTTTYTDIVPNALTTYYYRIRAENNYGFSAFSNLTNATTLATSLSSVKANKFGLRYAENTPGLIEFSYNLTQAANVKLFIYDLNGEKKESLVSEKQNALNYVIKWNTANVASGIYFAKLDTESENETIKLFIH